MSAQPDTRFFVIFALSLKKTDNYGTQQTYYLEPFFSGSFMRKCICSEKTSSSSSRRLLITVGYATGSMKTISGSVEKITETQMNKDQITNPLEAIRGRVPGLTIQRGTNGPAALDAVRLRGTTSLTSGNDPLIIVDGVFGDLSMLASIYPTDIESFTILKDASETSQYGSRGPPVSSKSLRRKE